MNIFTLSAAGLVALGLPFAAPWLAQEPSTAPVAPSTTALSAPNTTVFSLAAPSSPFAPAQESRAFAGTSESRVLDTRSPSTSSVIALDDDTAREIAELQARIAALQAEVAELSAARASGASAGNPNSIDLAEIVSGARRAQLESELVARDAAIARTRALEAQGLLSRVDAERKRVDAQAEGERRRAVHEAQRAAENARATYEANRAAFESRRAMLEDQRATIEAQIADLESAASDHESAIGDLESQLDEEELSEREYAELERQRESMQRKVERFLGQSERQQERFIELEEELMDLELSEERYEDMYEAQLEALEDLGYEYSDEDAQSEECEECEEVAEYEKVLEQELQKRIHDERVHEQLMGLGYVDTVGNEPSILGGIREEWLAAVGSDYAGAVAGAGHGAAVAERSPGGDVIVNVGGGGANEAQIVDLLREIRDEVRGLRADLRNLHGAPMPAAPRGSRSDFGYAPNSSSGPGVATGGGFGQEAEPFGQPQTIAPQAEEFPTIGNPYGDAPAAPSGSYPNALSSVEIRAPRAIRQPAPMIDAALRAAGPATVHVNLLVSEAGAVANAAVKSSTDSRFEQAALDAATQWVFEPGSIDGQPNAMFVDVPIVFP